MSQEIKIKVRPNNKVCFPGICVHCSQPAAEKLAVIKRIGRVTRRIDVPLCLDCSGELKRRSGEEERLEKIGRLAAGILAFLSLTLVMLLSPAELPLWLRLLVAVSLAFVLAQLALVLTQRAQKQAALPEKQAIYQAAQIVTFSWRATTFDFVNETFAERFRNMNESLLMDI